MMKLLRKKIIKVKIIFGKRGRIACRILYLVQSPLLLASHAGSVASGLASHGFSNRTNPCLLGPKFTLENLKPAP